MLKMVLLAAPKNNGRNAKLILNNIVQVSVTANATKNLWSGDDVLGRSSRCTDRLSDGHLVCANEFLYLVLNMTNNQIRFIFDSPNTLVNLLGPSSYLLDVRQHQVTEVEREFDCVVIMILEQRHSDL